MAHAAAFPVSDRMRRLLEFLVAVFMTGAATLVHADNPPESHRFASHEKLVAETHAASLKLREASLRGTIAGNTAWPSGTWGDNLWCLAALYLNEKTDQANARLLKSANMFIASKPEKIAETSPENPGNLPWTFFSITDYLRILYLFHAKSPHFPGRQKPKTEAAMKEALWLWVRGESRLAEAGPDDQFLLLGTENHDLNRRPPFYLITAFLNADPAYRNRKLEDGHGVADHAAAYTRYFREWPRSRAKNGLWIEVGSNTYQKYSWPALFNLHELSPDPVIRHRFGLLLDLAFIEEAQISVRGRRGGGQSRAESGRNGFDGYKNLFFSRDGKPAGSTHSRVIETSRYQLPAAAILLDRRAFPAVRPFAIRNRVLGELGSSAPDGEPQRIANSKDGGSYSTGKISIRFDAPGLEIIDEAGWIFASNGKAFASVKFLDGGHQWDKTGTIASPARFTGPADTGRILLHAGDLSSHGSFARFRKILPACPLVVTADKVDHRFGEGSQHMEMFRYDSAARKSFSLPRINGTPIDLHPATVYQSPFLNGVSSSDRITVNVGPVRQILDFACDP